MEVVGGVVVVVVGWSTTRSSRRVTGSMSQPNVSLAIGKPGNRCLKWRLLRHRPVQPRGFHSLYVTTGMITHKANHKPQTNKHPQVTG